MRKSLILPLLTKPKYKVIILIQCSDKVGLVAAISNVLAKNDINIISMREHVDTVNHRFFLRVETEGEAKSIYLQQQHKTLPSLFLQAELTRLRILQQTVLAQAQLQARQLPLTRVPALLLPILGHSVFRGLFI